MDDLVKEYESVIEEGYIINNEIKNLESNDAVKKYLELCVAREKNYSKNNEVYKKILINRYSSCDHVLVESYREAYNDYEGRTCHCYGCIKCGLDEAVMNRGYGYDREENVMLEIMKENHFDYINGIRTGVYYDLQKSRMIYADIKENNKNLPEEALIEIFKETIKAEKESKKLSHKMI